MTGARLRPTRLVLIGVALLVALLAAWAAYLAIFGLRAEHRLAAARSAVTRLRADLANPDVGSA